MPIPFLRRRRRRPLLARPFPSDWEQIVWDRLPFAAGFDEARAARFRDHLKVFAWEKHFEGVGLEVDEEMVVVVSGQAARLSHNLPEETGLDAFAAVDSVVLRPAAIKRDDARILGLVHRLGTMVLAWDAVKHGLGAETDGHDTAVHELAHVIDLGDHSFDGTPPFDDPGALRTFASVCAKHFLALQASVNVAKSEACHDETALLRAYGATNEAEFFAVAVEVFFEKPRVMKRRAPDLYAVLAAYFRQEPG